VFVTAKLYPVLAVAFVFACSKGSAPVAPVAKPKPIDVTQYIVEDSDFMVFVNMKQFVSGPFWSESYVQSELDRMGEEGSASKDLLDAGVNPFTNVDRMLISGNIASESVVVAISGAFDAPNAAESLKANARDAEAVDGILLISYSEGGLPTVKTARGLPGSPALMSNWSLIDTTKPFYFLASLPPDATEALGSIPIPGLASMGAIAVHLSLSSGVELLAVAQLGSEDDAGAASQGLAGIFPLLFAGMGLPQEILSTISIQHLGTKLSLTVNLDEQQSKVLRDRLELEP
jgi:hypothetical protein